MTYETMTQVSQIAAMLMFIGLSIGVGVYAFWPSNAKVFEHAARAPLAADPESPSEGASDE